MEINKIELEKGKYRDKKYNKKERFINYWYQIDGVLGFKPESVLEIGVGSGIVNFGLKKWVKEVKSLDINKSLNPDIVSSVTKIDAGDRSFDVVLCAEVLEHIPFGTLPDALNEIFRVAKFGAVISIPHKGATFSLNAKIPLINWIRFVFKIPYFWKTKTMTPEHYWEIGLKGYPLKNIKNEMKNTGFKIKKIFIPHDDSYRMFFILEK